MTQAGRRVLKENFCKSFIKTVAIKTAINVNFHFAHYKSMEVEQLQ